MTAPIPGKLKSNCPDFPLICDICQKNRSRGNHQKCSKKRQALMAERQAREIQS